MPITRTHRGRPLALVAAVGVVAIASVAAARWERFAVRYYLRCLQSDGSYLEQLVDTAEIGTAREKALREYCQTDEGGSALLNLFVRRTLGVAERRFEVDATQWSSIQIGITKGGGWWYKGEAWNAGDSTNVSLADHRRLHRALRIIDGREFFLQRYSFLTFKVAWHELGSEEAVVRAVRIIDDPTAMRAPERSYPPR